MRSIRRSHAKERHVCAIQVARCHFHEEPQATEDFRSSFGPQLMRFFASLRMTTDMVSSPPLFYRHLTNERSG